MNMASEQKDIVETSIRRPASASEDCDATNNEESANMAQTKRVEMAVCGGCKIEKPATMAYYSKTQLVKGGYRTANRGKENMMLRRQAKERKDEEVDVVDNQPSDYGGGDKGYKGAMMCKKCQTEKQSQQTRAAMDVPVSKRTCTNCGLVAESRNSLYEHLEDCLKDDGFVRGSSENENKNVVTVGEENSMEPAVTFSKTLRNDVSMPMLGFGTFRVKGEECVVSCETAYRAGYRLFDTAAMYRNQAEIAKALHFDDSIAEERHADLPCRDEIFITSKIPPGRQGNDEAYNCILEELALLQIDTLDLALIHWPGVQKLTSDNVLNAHHRFESWKGLNRLYREQKVRAIGVSNYTPDHLRELISRCQEDEGEEYPLEIPHVNQVECHPRMTQTELRDVCTEHGIVLQAYSSLGSSDPACQATLLNHPTVRSIAADHDIDSATVLIWWALQHDIPVIPKSVNPEHIRSNAQAVRLFQDDFTNKAFCLSEQDMNDLDSLNDNTHLCW
eukprot:CAMPEP_0194406672 /NCGR_PEP_ID=MMETSP0176-20130528/4800_1 /TAXON_ID=216777 /ORGANISM="Proboscia alata, Strain PI-D3" /LENGTH=503 /DNA_ID=CAMNT_0039205955 /DNA_START=163 /DNA_END=1671 /DNA_ORIENTATION=+